MPSTNPLWVHQFLIQGGHIIGVHKIRHVFLADIHGKAVQKTDLLYTLFLAPTLGDTHGHRRNPFIDKRLLDFDFFLRTDWSMPGGFVLLCQAQSA